MNVPVFFTAEDFYGKLLPGYATLFLTIYFFNFPSISSDISPTVLFIIGGPFVGYILLSVGNYIFKFLFFWKKPEKKEEYKENYAKIRVIATERQISEVNSFLSFYYLCIATGPPFCVLSMVKIVMSGYQQEFFPVLTFVIGIVLLWMSINQFEGVTYILRAISNEISDGHKPIASS